MIFILHPPIKIIVVGLLLEPVSCLIMDSWSDLQHQAPISSYGASL